jgi:hypothetical protein
MVQNRSMRRRTHDRPWGRYSGIPSRWLEGVFPANKINQLRTAVQITSLVAIWIARS